MWPHWAHLRRCNHHPPRAKHSTQPVPLGLAAGLIPSLSDFIGSSLTSFCFSCPSSTGGPKGRRSDLSATMSRYLIDRINGVVVPFSHTRRPACFAQLL